MPGGGQLRFLKDKVDGFKKFHQIVKTIKMVTLAKYRQTVLRVRIRDETLRYTRKVFDREWDEDATIEASERLLYFPITTNRGSCGSLNSNMFRYLEELESEKMSIIAVGKKGNDSLSKLQPESFEAAVINDMKQALSFYFAGALVEFAHRSEWDRMQIIYNRFVSAGTQKMAIFNIPSFAKWQASLLEEDPTDTEVDPAGDALNNGMMKQYLAQTGEEFQRDFYDFHATLAMLNACTENELSEYAARILAVENQLNNITDLMHEYEYKYNKQRKEGITAELLEIISAMIAMAGNEAGEKLEKSEFWQ